MSQPVDQSVDNLAITHWSFDQSVDDLAIFHWSFDQSADDLAIFHWSFDQSIHDLAICHWSLVTVKTSNNESRAREMKPNYLLQNKCTALWNATLCHHTIR
jgi:hypothetical protein